MRTIANGSIPGLVLFLFLGLLPVWAEPAPEGSRPWATQTPGAMPVKEQFKLAFTLYDEMAKAENWDLELFIKDHRRVIDECPDTPSAIESCWRLSNLYLTGKPSPDYPEVIKLMEHVLARYPGNPWRERVANRLVNVLQDAGEHRKLLEFCEAQLQAKDLGAEDFLAYALRAGQAAETLGQGEPAARFFQQVVQRDAGEGSIFAQIAQRHLDRLQSPAPADPQEK